MSARRQSPVLNLKRVSLPGEIADIACFMCTAPAITAQVIAAENGLLLNNG